MNQIIQLTPSIPENWLTNGEVYGKKIDTLVTNASLWTEITAKEYYALFPEELVSDSELLNQEASDPEILEIVLGEGLTITREEALRIKEIIDQILSQTDPSA